MNFELDEDLLHWRDEVRAFIKESMSDELLAEWELQGREARGPATMEFRREMGERGWFGVNWPKEYGGLDLGPIYQHILVRELEYWHAPALDLTVTSIAPMLMKYGTEQNRNEFLPLIGSGEMRVALGYSEPNAGTDLASLRTTARLEGDEWVINGSKIWNSHAHTSTHEWLCVRTDPNAAKHKGISVIIVPLDAPGIEIRPLVTWANFRTNETFFTDVRVPATNLVGEVNRGWYYIAGALDLERGALTNVGDLRRAVDDLTQIVTRGQTDGTCLADSESVRSAVAELDADVEVAELMGLEAASILQQGRIPTVEVTIEKIFGSELRQKIATVAMSILGMDGAVAPARDNEMAGGIFQLLYRQAPLLRFGGGTNEVLRDVIAQRGHGLPRWDR